MLAPIDATATVQAGDEAIVLMLNFRTLALAKDKGVDLLSGAASIDWTALPKVVAAFATPAQPDFTEEHAFALMVQSGTACGEAVTELLEKFAAVATPQGGAARPPVAPRRKRPAS